MEQLFDQTPNQQNLLERITARAALRFENRPRWQDLQSIASRASSHTGRSLILATLVTVLGMGALACDRPLRPAPNPLPTPGVRLGSGYSDETRQLVFDRVNIQELYILNHSSIQVMFQHGIIANYVDGLSVRFNKQAAINLSRDSRVGLGLGPYDAAAVYLTPGGSDGLAAADRFAGEEFNRLNMFQFFNETFPPGPRPIPAGALPVYGVINSVVGKSINVDVKSIPASDFSKELSRAWIRRVKQLSARPVQINSFTLAAIEKEPPLTVISIDPGLIRKANSTPA